MLILEDRLRYYLDEMRKVYNPDTDWDYDKGALAILNSIDQWLARTGKTPQDEKAKAEACVYHLAGYLAKMSPEEKRKTVEDWNRTYFS